MSLKRQLMWLGLSVLTLLLAATIFIVGHNLKKWVEQDSAQRALDTASAIAQAIAPGLAAGQENLVVSLIDGILDDNAYKELRISGPSLENAVVREGAQTEHGVPSWFANLVSIAPPGAEVRLAGDNGQDHTITLTLSTADLHKRLWTALLQLLGAFLIGGDYVGGVSIDVSETISTSVNDNFRTVTTHLPSSVYAKPHYQSLP